MPLLLYKAHPRDIIIHTQENGLIWLDGSRSQQQSLLDVPFFEFTEQSETIF